MHYNDDILSIYWAEKKTLLDGLRSNNVPVPFSCGGEGICTTCRVILIKGDLTDPTLLESERAKERGFHSNERLSCQCKALSQRIELKIP